MENKKNRLYVLMIACLLGVTAIAGIGFAVLSQNLKIGNPGAGTVTIPGWNVYLNNLLVDAPTATSTHAKVWTPPGIDINTKKFITAYNVSLQYPGSTFSFTFDIINSSGSINAQIASISKGLSVDSNTGTSADQLLTQNLIDNGQITYTLAYNASPFSAVAVGDALDAGKTKTVKATVKWVDDSITFPLGSVKILVNATTFGFKSVG